MHGRVIGRCCSVREQRGAKDDVEELVFFVSEGFEIGFVWVCFFFNDTATTEIYTLSLHDALPILSSSSNWIRIKISFVCILSSFLWISDLNRYILFID